MAGFTTVYTLYDGPAVRVWSNPHFLSMYKEYTTPPAPLAGGPGRYKVPDIKKKRRKKEKRKNPGQREPSMMLVTRYHRTIAIGIHRIPHPRHGCDGFPLSVYETLLCTKSLFQR